jgi:hypothetical protein
VSARDELIAALEEHACCFTPEDAARMVDAFAHELFEQTRNGDTYKPARARLVD